MSSLTDRLAAIPLFAELAPEDLESVCSGSDELALAPGQLLFSEGDIGDHAYVITGGEVEIRKASLGREVLLAVRAEGDVIGEMALLQEEPRNATAIARTDVELARIPKSVLDELLATSASAARSLTGVLLRRWRETQSQLRQSERMAQLGTLTAGLAHELNNPAAAVQRASAQLAEAVSRLDEARSTAAALTSDSSAVVDALRARPAMPAGSLDGLARSDRETAVEDWLRAHDIENGWEFAPALVELGIDSEELGRLLSALPPSEIPTVLQLVRASTDVRGLLHEVSEGSTRLSAIVQALKSYSYLDRAPEQSVDVRVGLDDTLLLMESTLAGIAIVRQYDAELPTIEALGSELNQVWTHLIDNAAAAVRASEDADGRIFVRASTTRDEIVVEVEDDGVGIPPDHQERIFDAFFTTKPPGSGTGLGLDICSRVVVEHGGSLTLVHSEQGRTVFRVALPLDTRVRGDGDD